MKPVVTWILVANTRNASVLANRGPGKGLADVSGAAWVSEGADMPRDKAGVGHSIGGHGVSAVDQPDPQGKIDASFAQSVAGRLMKALAAGQFDRLIIVAGPHMLGLLRQSLDDRLRAVLIGEVDKDLSGQSAKAVARHLVDFIAV